MIYRQEIERMTFDGFDDDCAVFHAEMNTIENSIATKTTGEMRQETRRLMEVGNL